MESSDKAGVRLCLSAAWSLCLAFPWGRTGCNPSLQEGKTAICGTWRVRLHPDRVPGKSKAETVLFAAVAVLLAAAQAATARPGYGEPLSLTTGVVYTVDTLSELKTAVNTVNAAGVPATILLSDGTYVLDVSMLHITCPGLIVRSAGGHRNAVVVRGPDEGTAAALRHVFLLSANDVVIADMTLGYCRHHGIQIQGESPRDVSGTWVHNCRLVNCNEQFIKGSSSGGDPVGATDGIIENCLFEFTGGWAYQYYTGGIDIHKGVNWIVRDNLFRNIRNPSGQSGLAEHAVHFWKRCPTHPQNVIVERNLIVNCDRGIGFGLGGTDDGHNGGASVIRNNMVYNDGTGGHTDVGIGLESASGVSVDHNTVVVPSYWAPMEYRFAGCSNVVFRNNLTDKAIRNRNNAPAAAMTGNVESGESAWFRDMAGGDLHLTAGAHGALDRGCAGAAADDVDGDTRPWMGGPDVGADEYRPGWARLAEPQTAAFDEGLSPTRVLHVAPGGTDAPGHGTGDRPYVTPGYAARFATPGTAVVLAPGTYPGGGSVSGLAGTPEAPIWIRGSSATNRAILSGANAGLHLTRVRYLVVENLEVSGSAHNGINCDDGGDYGNATATHHVVFRNLDIHDIGGTGNQDGLKLSGVNRYRVLDCRFARCGGSLSGSGIDHVGCHSGVVARCVFEQMSGNAVQCKGGSADIDITQCRILDGGARGVNIGGSTGPAYFRPPLFTNAVNVEARAIRVTANVFRGASAPVAFVGCTDCLVANNTIVDPEDWFLRILQESVSSPPYDFLPCGENAFMNNLVYFERAGLKGTDINVGGNTAPASFLFANNLWYAHDRPGESRPDYPVTESGGLVGENPALFDPGNGDYAIGVNSPATRAGRVSGTLYRDFTGKAYLRPPSSGACEVSGDLDRDGLSDAWELRHFDGTNATNGGVAEDADGDRFRDGWEYLAGTDPTNALSLFALRGDTAAEGIRLRWPSAADRTYSVYWTTSLAGSADMAVLTSGLPATPATNTYDAPRDPASAQVFYRVRVGFP